jgi:hypothetical protein
MWVPADIQARTKQSKGNELRGVAKATANCMRCVNAFVTLLFSKQSMEFQKRVVLRGSCLGLAEGILNFRSN